MQKTIQKTYINILTEYIVHSILLHTNFWSVHLPKIPWQKIDQLFAWQTTTVENGLCTG